MVNGQTGQCWPIECEFFLIQAGKHRHTVGIYIEECSHCSRNLAFRGQLLQYTSLVLMFEDSVLFTKLAW